jgi:hypothetical protein
VKGLSVAIVLLQFAAREVGDDKSITNSPNNPAILADEQGDNITARAQLGEGAFEKACQEGRAMSMGQAITYALEIRLCTRLLVPV